jgi:hypothetical protein
MFKIELPKIYLSDAAFSVSGFLKKYKIGKKERDIRKKRQKMMISIGSLYVRILSAVQPPPHSSIASRRRY